MSTSGKETLHIIIVNHKATDFLAGCLASIPRHAAGIDISVTVIDNNSSEKSALGELRQQYQWVEFIFNQENIGFARACNQGIAGRNPDLFLLLNPDTVVDAEAIANCALFLLEHQEAGIAGCRILNPDGSVQKASRRNIPTPVSALLHFSGIQKFLKNSRLAKPYHSDVLDGEEPQPAEAVSGSFMMFKREAGLDIGFLDEDYFMYGEDLDFCLRALQAGWKTFYLPGVSILHHKRISSSRSAEKAEFHFYQSMEIFYIKHFYHQDNFIKRNLVLIGIKLLRAYAIAKRRLTGRREVGSAG